MKPIDVFKKILITRTEKFLSEYNDITSQMQPYDVAAFDSELNSAYDYYSSMYFDEVVFKKMAKYDFGIDLDKSDINELLSESIGNYSRAMITIKTLHRYIRCNNIMTEVDNERMVYSS